MASVTSDRAAFSFLFDDEGIVRWRLHARLGGQLLSHASIRARRVDFSWWWKFGSQANFDGDEHVGAIGRRLFDEIVAPDPHLPQAFGRVRTLLRGGLMPEQHDVEQEHRLTVSFAGPLWLLHVPLEFINPGYDPPWAKRFSVIRQTSTVSPDRRVSLSGQASSLDPAARVLVVAASERREATHEVNAIVNDLIHHGCLVAVAHFTSTPVHRRIIDVILPPAFRPTTIQDHVSNWWNYEVVVLCHSPTDLPHRIFTNARADAKTRLVVATGVENDFFTENARLFGGGPLDTVGFRSLTPRSLTADAAVPFLLSMLRDRLSPATALLRYRATSARWWEPKIVANCLGSGW